MHGDTGYHTYGVFWTPTQLFYYCDDFITGCHDITDPQFFQLRECPQVALLTFPIGGSVPGTPNPALDSAEYLVDYVRVYQADDGYNTDTNYQGAYGFPQLNDLDQPISYYQEAIDAYSHVYALNAYNHFEMVSGAEQSVKWGSPFPYAGRVCNIKKSTATIKTLNSYGPGKYDIYINGLKRPNNKDYVFYVNGVGIGTVMKLSDYAKDKYGREYSAAESTYIGTAEITSGTQNFEITVSEAQAYGSGYSNGQLLTATIIKNNSSIPTVTLVGDEITTATPTTTIAPTTTATPTTTSTTTAAAAKYNINISNKEKYVSSREITDDSGKEDITMILVIGQSNSTTAVGYPCELTAVNKGNRDEVSEVTTTPEKNTVFMAKYKQTITSLGDSNDVATLIENEHIGGYSAALGKKWNELTGEKVVIVQAAVGASGMHEWVKDNTKYACACGHSNNHYAKAVNQFNACYNALKENYNIKHSFYIWNQGEHDERYYAQKKDLIDINSSEKYYEAYKSMHEDLLNDLPLDFGGINIARANDHSNSMYLTIARIGQYKAINELKGCYLASRLFENATKDDMDQTAEGSYGIHAIQKTYNAMGTDAATNLYNAVLGNNGGLKSIEIIKNNGRSGAIKSQFNGKGELITGSSVIGKDEEISIAVSPCGDYKVSFSVNGDSSLVDDFGTPVDSAFSDSNTMNISCSTDKDVIINSTGEIQPPKPIVSPEDNLITGGTWEVGQLNRLTGLADTTSTYGKKRAYYTKLIDVVPGETYTFVLDTHQTAEYILIVRAYDENGKLIGTLDGAHNSVGFSGSLTPNYIPSKDVMIPDNIAKIGLTVYYDLDSSKSYNGQTIVDAINYGDIDVAVGKVESGTPTTTAAPTTIAPTTTVAPTTTAAPTTTVAPTTTIAPTTAPTTIITPIIYGDANGDGSINLLDLIAIRKHLAKWSVSVDKQATDCNADGTINLLDLILMRKYLAKWNVILGPQK